MGKTTRRSHEFVASGGDSGLRVLPSLGQAGSEREDHCGQGQAIVRTATETLRSLDLDSESERLVLLILETKPKRCPKRDAVIAAQILESLK
jgi:hypothetical protein